MASPIHCAVKLLKAYCSPSHVLDGSQATSVMIPGLAEESSVLLAPVKKTDMDESRPFVRIFHVAFAFVWAMSV